MDLTYDFFEVLPDGGVMWRRAVTGREAALKELESMAQLYANEIRVLHLATKSVLATKAAKQSPDGDGYSPSGDGNNRHFH